jgi:hypothetical protein
MDSLLKTIDFLRKDVQFLIDKKKKTTDKTILQSIDIEKESKINKLNELSQKLKELKREKEIKQVFNKIDSLHFSVAHKKNTGEALDKAKKVKQIRAEYREQYAIYVEYEKKYFEMDPKDVPGILFLHESVVKKYGLCRHILFDIQSDPEIIRKERLDWLATQDDKGQEYFDLYKKVIKEVEINKLIENRGIIEEEFMIKLESILSESQNNIYQKSLEIITEYTECNIKTKILKERFKTLIHNLSILYHETGIPFHEFWSLKYKCNIVINNINSKDSNNPIQKITSYEFEDLLAKYRDIIADIDIKTKYNLNTKRNLTNELYLLYLNNSKKQEVVIQTGKYFRRWAVLSEAERNERFHSFADFFIRKKYTEKSDEDKCDLIEKLSSLLISSYKEKKLIYRDFIWNTSKGMIENIKVLQYLDDGSVTLSHKAGKEYTPRKVSVKTIFTKDNDKIINEEILYFIVTKVNESHLTKIDKEQCAEKIKNKLKVKKLTTKDKGLLDHKIEEIYEIVQANKEDI